MFFLILSRSFSFFIVFVLPLFYNILFGKDFFDGNRDNGYGGYYYNEKFWTNVIPDFVKFYNLKDGDKILDKPLALIGGKGHFTKELEDAMLAGEADIAVHSLKDVPTYIPEGLELVSVTQRQDQSDVFLSHTYKTIEDLPQGAVVGTTSLRRRMQLLCKRPDLKVKDLSLCKNQINFILPIRHFFLHFV